MVFKHPNGARYCGKLTASLEIRVFDPSNVKSFKKPFSKVDNVNSNEIFQITYEIKVNSFRKGMLKGCKNIWQMKTKCNVTELFILILDKPLSSRIYVIKENEK